MPRPALNGLSLSADRDRIFKAVPPAPAGHSPEASPRPAEHENGRNAGVSPALSFPVSVSRQENQNPAWQKNMAAPVRAHWRGLTRTGTAPIT